MAHTDRDEARHFWKRHYGNRGLGIEGDCTLYTQPGGWGFIRGSCWCEKVYSPWTQAYKYEKGQPSWWNKECRQQERAYSRNMMNKARNGHIPWDNLTINYRRPYYW